MLYSKSYDFEVGTPESPRPWDYLVSLYINNIREYALGEYVVLTPRIRLDDAPLWLGIVFYDVIS